MAMPNLGPPQWAVARHFAGLGSLVGFCVLA